MTTHLLLASRCLRKLLIPVVIKGARHRTTACPPHGLAALPIYCSLWHSDTLRKESSVFKATSNKIKTYLNLGPWQVSYCAKLILLLGCLLAAAQHETKGPTQQSSSIHTDF